MKNLLDPTDRQQLIARIHRLTADTKPQWGKMDAGQMVTHCQRPLELALANPKPPRQLLGYIMGPMLRKSVFGPKPFERNSFTPPEFKIVDPQDFKENKEKLLKLIDRFPVEMPHVGHVHPFFGPVTLDSWGEGQYKHLDHHLTQFGM